MKKSESFPPTSGGAEECQRFPTENIYEKEPKVEQNVRMDPNVTTT